MPGAVLLKLSCAHTSLGYLVKMQILIQWLEDGAESLHFWETLTKGAAAADDDPWTTSQTICIRWPRMGAWAPIVFQSYKENLICNQVKEHSCTHTHVIYWKDFKTFFSSKNNPSNLKVLWKYKVTYLWTLIHSWQIRKNSYVTVQIFEMFWLINGHVSWQNAGRTYS